MTLQAVLEGALAWPAEIVAVGCTDAHGTLPRTGRAGPSDRPFPLASVTKVITSLAALVAVEEGTVALDDPVAAAPAGATLRHLLAHASGLPFEGREPVAAVGARRIYSNTGFDLLAAHVAERAGMAFGAYAREAVAEPLGIDLGWDEPGGAAKGGRASVDGLLRLARELLAPRLLAPTTLAAATSVQFPGLAGVLPGIGRMDPCDWGLGLELRGTKAPHWTGSANSHRTFGHFGGSGTFLWVDPEAGIAAVALTHRPFGSWALDHWPPFADALLAASTGPTHR